MHVPMPQTLSGTIERVTFHNPDNGFVVLKVQTDEQREPITVVGHVGTATAGEQITAVGEWTIDREHGRQFHADQISTSLPRSAADVVRYLGSGLIKGIGPTYARKIVDVFGERTLEIIDSSPNFLGEIKGIGPARLDRIRSSWQEQKAVRKILMFLHEHGIGTARAVRIHREYGDKAIELVQENPYRLATDIWGIGFKTADALAERLGIDRQSPFRARAALRYVLQELSSQGHVGFPEVEVVRQTVELTDIGESVVVGAVEAGCREDELVREAIVDGDKSRRLASSSAGPALYLKPLFLAEVGVARRLLQLCVGDHPLAGSDVAAELRRVEEHMGLELAAAQRDAIQQAATQKVLVVTGGPGVGKTTIVRGILDLFAAHGLRCQLCAPTGRAAKRLSESTGREAKTIHRLLEFEGRGFRRGRELPLETDLLVVDEASMVDVVLMNQLLRAVPDHACLVVVGDVDQLPSVGPGSVLADIISSGAVPVVRLTHIFRQAGASWIVRAAHQLNSGELPESAPAGGGDFYFVEADTPELILDRILTMIRERIPARFGLHPVNDVQLLTPMNRFELGAHLLNQRLQEALNPQKTQPQIERFGTTFRVGDKVLQVINNYDKEVFNGDIGRVVRIAPEDRDLSVDYDGRTVTYDFSELDELTLAYALSIHRSQGSEYPAVIVPLHTQHFALLQRNLLYTAITRGKKLVVLVGSRKALSLAVCRTQTQNRYSALGWRLAKSPVR